MWICWQETITSGFNGTYDIAIIRTGFEPDASSYDVMFTEEGLGNLNYSQYVNPEIQSMLNEAMSTVDTEARAELYRQAMELAEQDAIYVPLYTPSWR